MYLTNTTIVALATPPGAGAIGVIRLSGPEAITVAEKIFKGKKLADQPTHTLHFGNIVSTETGKIIDEVVISLYRGPRSYTGEDVVEISCHGSQYILEQVIMLCTLNGAVVALPGEYTQRAFLNGKLDLTQAEAVADLIASQSEAAHKSAIHNLRGGFSNDLKAMREELITFSALIELELDFSQEDVEFADRTKLYALIDNMKNAVTRLIQSFMLGNAIKSGVKVAIVGSPNAGKSTLLNALLNEERAIVSEIAGTTRDTIEENLNINGVLFRLIDTAGIRAHGSDAIENIGIDRSRQAIQQADVVVCLFDAAAIASLTDQPEAFAQAIAQQQEELQSFLHKDSRFLIAGNKADKADAATLEKIAKELGQPVLFISAKDRDNLQTLKQSLYDLVIVDPVSSEGTIVSNARHHAALQEVLRSLNDIREGMNHNLSGELLALDIRQCLFYLGSITGEVQVDRDVLGAIFGKFCIGK